MPESVSRQQEETIASFDWQWRHLAEDGSLGDQAILLWAPGWRDKVDAMIQDELGLTQVDLAGKRVLDVGCGQGRWAYGLKKMGCDVLGIDTSPAGVESAEKWGLNARVLNLFDIADAGLAEQFDLVWCWGVIHHTADPERAFRSVADAVKRGGLIHCYVYSRPRSRRVVAMRHILRPFGFPVRRRIKVRGLDSAYITAVYTKGSMHYPLPSTQRFRSTRSNAGAKIWDWTTNVGIQNGQEGAKTSSSTQEKVTQAREEPSGLKTARRAWARCARYFYGRHSLRAIPTQVGLCLTHLCNIHCVYCMREKFQPPKASMTLERVKTLMGRMPYVSGVCIMGLCEPLMNPQTPDILRWLKDQGGYSTSLTTNGVVPLNRDMLDALLRVDDMVFSIDTSDPETFRYLRGGADLNRVMENLGRLLQFKHELGLGRLDKPPVHINAVITSENFHQIPGLIKMLESYAVQLTYLMVDPVTRPDYQDFEEPLMIQRAQLEQHIGEYRRIARDSPLKIVGFDYMLESSRNWRDCPMSWYGMFVQPNGDAYFCYDYEYTLGNVFQENPLFVWNSSRARQFRERLRTSDPPLIQCHSCNFARKGWQPSGIYYRTKQDAMS